MGGNCAFSLVCKRVRGGADDGKSEFYERRERRDLCAEEIKATLDLLWGGSSAVEKRMRLLVTERIFGIKSRESVAALSLDKLERGLKILQAFDKRAAPTSRSSTMGSSKSCPSSTSTSG